ncbi:MAG: hypothetical protein AAGG69_12080 [Pseudomonadota bacterium]
MRLLVGLRQVFVAAMLVTMWSAPMVHRADAGEPNLMRLVDFVKFVTPDGELPVLCANDETGEAGAGLSPCEACIAAAISAANEPSVCISLSTHFEHQTAHLQRIDVHASEDALGALRQRGPPVV